MDLNSHVQSAKSIQLGLKACAHTKLHPIGSCCLATPAVQCQMHNHSPTLQIPSPVYEACLLATRPNSIQSPFCWTWPEWEWSRILSVILRYPAVLLQTLPVLQSVHFTSKFNCSLFGYCSVLLQSSVAREQEKTEAWNN